VVDGCLLRNGCGGGLLVQGPAVSKAGLPAGDQDVEVAAAGGCRAGRGAGGVGEAEDGDVGGFARDEGAALMGLDLRRFAPLTAE
jgi:hypothetical protein